MNSHFFQWSYAYQAIKGNIPFYCYECWTWYKYFSGEIAWRRRWHPTPVFLPGKSHGWRSLVGCSPWGHWGSDTTERLHFHFSLFTFLHWRRKWQPTPVFLPREPRDGGAWWAAVYGVTQSRTRLKWLSSSSSSSIAIYCCYQWNLSTWKLHSA